MFRASTARHQEVKPKYVANGTSKMTVSKYADSHLRSTICHMHTPYLLMIGCLCPKHVEVP
jgi:hypothetical protein